MLVRIYKTIRFFVLAFATLLFVETIINLRESFISCGNETFCYSIDTLVLLSLLKILGIIILIVFVFIKKPRT